MNYLVGTSEWEFEEWRRSFYPEDLHRIDYLGYYSKYFNAVEINRTYFKLPYENHLKIWNQKVPDDFVFTVKMSWQITHKNLMKDNDANRKFLSMFFKRLEALDNKVKYIVVRLPGKLKFDSEVINRFRKMLTDDYEYVFEGRDGEWKSDKFVQYSLAEGLNLLSYSSYDGNFFYKGKKLYFRLDGKVKENPYSYSDGELEEFAKIITDPGYEESVVYFNNNLGGNAIRNAVTLKNILTQG